MRWPWAEPGEVLADSERAGASVTSDMVCSFLARISGGDGLADLDERREAAPEHALAVERHRLGPGLHFGIGHDFLPARIAGLLVGPGDEGEDDIFAFLGLHRHKEIGDLAVL